MAEPGNTVEDLIAEVRRQAGPEMVPSRQQAEEDARQLLDRSAGAMSAEQVKELASLFNRGSWGGAVKHNRFLPGFSVPLIEQMVSDIEKFNELTATMWRGEEDEALAVVDRILRDSSVLPGSGQSYPTVLMYLRDPGKFAVWTDMLDRGLAELDDYEPRSRNGGADDYLEFCRSAQALATERGLQPQEIDAVLSASAKAKALSRVETRRQAETPTITRAAFEFLRDLSQNNNKEWFDENRERYERDLRDPLTAVMQELADRYIVGLDPRINATVKRDVVMARIYKYSQGDPYHTYFWGAFSRHKKQEDVQLYVNIGADYLHFGLLIGSAPAETVNRLIAGFERFGDTLVERTNRLAPMADWDPTDSQTIEVSDAAQAITWARGADPHLRMKLAPDDPLIGSQALVECYRRAVRGSSSVGCHRLGR